MPDSPSRQRKSRANAKLDASVVADLAFFAEPDGTKRHKAAILLAEDELTDRQIAAKLKIGRTTLHRWKQEPEFQQVMGDYRGQIVAEALKLPIAKKHERIRILNDSLMADLEARRLRGETYAARVGTPEEAARDMFGSMTPPWAATGKYVEQPEIAANGKMVTEWAYDKALESSINDKLKQAAQELGQVDQTLNVNHAGEVSIEIAETVRRLATQYGVTEAEIVALAAEDDA